MSTVLSHRRHHHHHHHHHLVYTEALQHNHGGSFSPIVSQLKFHSHNRNPNFTHRTLRIIPKSSSPRQNPSTRPEPPPPETNPPPPDPIPPAESSSTNQFSLLFGRFGEKLSLDELGMDIVSIALPAALALAADPLASLVDTAFVGHLGSVELAAVGVSISVFNLVSKLFNIPLLNITTSFVAEEQALLAKGGEESIAVDLDPDDVPHKKTYIPSVSASLVLAAAIGIAETFALSFGSGFILNRMGIPVDSPMRVPAEQFTIVRAFGAPPIVIALAAQGTFRGFKDTKTPLYAVVAGNLLNAILDPILIFFFHLGVDGAAIATVISEYLIAFILLWKLNSKVLLVSPNIDGGRVAGYLKSGGLLMARSLSVLVTMTIATSMAAREGPVPMAGYQICLEIWLALSLLTDALALAGQALLASEFTQGNYSQSREVISRILQIGLTSGVSLAVILFLGFGPLSSLFTSDTSVLEIARSGTLFVAGSQPMNAIAFVLDGLYYGVSDFGYAAYSMVLIGLISSVFVLLAAPLYGLAAVWAGLFLFMTLRVVAGIWRLSTKGGPWKLVLSEIDQKNS